MRDIVLATIIFGSLPLIMMRPWVGIIMWNWVSFMNPHRMSWGFMFDMPIAMIIAVVTLAAWALSKEDKSIPWNSIAVLIVIFLVWTSITTIFAIESDAGYYKWKQFLKATLMLFVALSLIKKEDQLRVLIWTAVVSIGYFSFKGGIFTVLTGGGLKVYGPPNTQIEENNALAVATLMVIPMMLYLAQTSKLKWVKLGLYSGVFFSFVSVVGSQSRGAFLGLAAIGLFLWLKSNRKLISGSIMAIMIVGGLAFVPQKWVDRMNTIQTYQEDESAVGRLEMWTHAIRIANDRPLVAGGFGVFGSEATLQRLSPEMTQIRAAHSIYFEVLAYHGYIGLFLFLMIGFAGIQMSYRIKRLAKGRAGFEHEYKFANLIQVSLMVYAVPGAFLSLAHYDLYYSLLALIALQYMLIQRKIRVAETGQPDTALPVASGIGRLLQPAGIPGKSFLRNPSR